MSDQDKVGSDQDRVGFDQGRVGSYQGLGHNLLQDWTGPLTFGSACAAGFTEPNFSSHP